jgi:hypothetical protein
VAVNTLLNLVLQPTLAALGASIATLVACFSSSVIMMALGQRYIRIAIPTTTVLFYAVASGVMYLLITQVDTGNPIMNLLIKFPLGASVFALAAWCRESEVRQIGKRLVTRLLR